MPKREPKKQPLRIPAQRAVDELISMPWSQDVSESSFDPFQTLDKQKRRFVAALIANYGDEVAAAKCAMNMFQMSDTEALEHAFIFRSDPGVVEAIKRATDYLISRRGELYLGALRQAATIAATSPDEAMRLKAIQFLADNVGVGLENREALIAGTGGANGEGSQMKTMVEMISASMAGAAAGGAAGVIGAMRQPSKMIPVDVEQGE